jgi:murein DD-endopeptidase MepM/ murein hydrolase activator NlpD
LRLLLSILLLCGVQTVSAAEYVEPALTENRDNLTHGALVMDRVTPASERSLELRGPLVQGGVVFGSTRPGASLMHDDQPVPVSSKGEFVIGFERMAPAESTLRVVLPDGSIVKRTLKLTQREYDIERIDGLPQEKVTPDPALSQRIAQEQALVKQARALVDERTDYVQGFEWPVTGRISGVYGSQRILNGEPKWPHYGVDIARPEGTPVAAPADATIILAHPDMFYSGATLIMDHGQGFSSTFLHLQKILVKEGQRVKRGEIVGLLGASGRATGPHLDWRMNLRGKRVDPTTVVGPMPKLENVTDIGI